MNHRQSNWTLRRENNKGDTHVIFTRLALQTSSLSFGARQITLGPRVKSNTGHRADSLCETQHWAQRLQQKDDLGSLVNKSRRVLLSCSLGPESLALGLIMPFFPMSFVLAIPCIGEHSPAIFAMLDLL